MSERGTLLVGLGTPHGDDCVGLRIAERLAAESIPGVQVKLARSPAEILNWLEDVERLVVCDACRSDASPVGTVHHWEWPAAEIQEVRFAGSHDLSVPAVLTLAERLGQLPPRVAVVGVEMGTCEPGETISPELEAQIPSLIERVRGVLEECMSCR